MYMYNKITMDIDFIIHLDDNREDPYDDDGEKG